MNLQKRIYLIFAYPFFNIPFLPLPYLLVLLCLVLSNCSEKIKKNPFGKLKIVCTTGLLGDAVSSITKDSAEVISLMGPGVDPHLYKASYKDLENLSSADIIVYNGIHLEGKMVEVLKRLSKQKKVISAADALHDTDLRITDPSSHNADPHIWFNVRLWYKVVNHIGKELMKQDTSHKKFYENNLTVFLKNIKSLDAWVTSEINTIPKSNRVLVTAHDAFGYFGDAYNIEVRGLQGISTLSDFGLNDISSLVKEISQRKIKAVFVESSVPKKSINAVMEGCKARGHHVQLGGTLYSDALGNSGTKEATYLGMVTYNVSKITAALK